MFHLESEIHAWCQSFRSRNHANVEELKDHLYCEIDQLTEQGLTEKQAFVIATERMGNPAELRKEYAKNRFTQETFCYIAAGIMAVSGLVHLSELYQHVIVELSIREAAKDVFIGFGLMGFAVYKFFKAERKRKLLKS